MNGISHVLPQEVYGNFETQSNAMYATSILNKIADRICNFTSSSGSGARINASDFNNSLALQFDELMQLQDHWFEGGGIAPNKNKLAFFAKKVIESYPTFAALPLIAPTQNGNLLLEWDVEGHPSIDINFNDMSAYYHTFGIEGEEMEKSLPLITENDFDAFFVFLSTHIPPKTYEYKL